MGRRALVPIVILGLLASPLEAAESGASPESSPDSALRRLGATMRLAADHGPEPRREAAMATLERARGDSETHAPPPRLEYLREGIGTGFDNRPNAQQQLSLSWPFNDPGQSRAARALRDSGREAQSARELRARREASLDAGRRWLQLAARIDEAEIARRRDARLTRTLILHRKRLELGEVAGAEVTQLELRHATEFTRLQRLLSEIKRADRDLSARVGERVEPPAAGDLLGIVEKTRTPSPSTDDIERAIRESPTIDSARRHAEWLTDLGQLERSVAWGRPEAVVGWQRVPDLGVEKDYSAAVLGLSFPLPLGKAGRSRNRLGLAMQTAATASLETSRMVVATEIGAALDSARAARSSLDALEVLLAGLERNEFSLAEQFRLGSVSYLVYIDGLTRFDEIRLTAVEARLELATARLLLANLPGRTFETGFPLLTED